MALQIGRVFEQPIIGAVIVIFGLWLYTNVPIYERAGNIILVMGILGILFWMIFNLTKKPFLDINTQKGNTAKAIVVALVGLMIVAICSMTLGTLFLGWTAGSVTDFVRYAKGATIGATVSPFANSPLLEYSIYVFFIAIAETVTFVTAFMIMLVVFKAQLSLKDPKVWMAALLTGVLTIFYHIYAKTVGSSPNPNSLIIVGILFTVECLMVVYLKELEPAIWNHMINNAVALGFTAVMAAFFTNWIFVLLIVLVFIAGNTEKGKQLLRRWSILS